MGVPAPGREDLQGDPEAGGRVQGELGVHVLQVSGGVGDLAPSILDLRRCRMGRNDRSFEKGRLRRRGAVRQVGRITLVSHVRTSYT